MQIYNDEREALNKKYMEEIKNQDDNKKGVRHK